MSDKTNFIVRPASTCLNSAGALLSLPLSGGSESCTLIVGFSPQTVGAQSTTISVQATQGGTSQTVTLTGTSLGSLSINLGASSTAPQAFTSTQTFRITHSGSSTTGLLSSSLGGTNASVFVITNDGCYGTALTGTGFCDVTVKFIGTPSSTTAQTGTLTVSDGTSANAVTGYFKVGGP